MLILTAVRGMTTLESVQEIEILYTTLVNGLNKDQSETMRQLFLDTIVMTGTPHSVEFFEKMVREGKATTHEINSFFMFLPRYIMTPTQQVNDSILSDKFTQENIETHNNINTTPIITSITNTLINTNTHHSTHQ